MFGLVNHGSLQACPLDTVPALRLTPLHKVISIMEITNFLFCYRRWSFAHDIMSLHKILIALWGDIGFWFNHFIRINAGAVLYDNIWHSFSAPDKYSLFQRGIPQLHSRVGNSFYIDFSYIGGLYTCWHLAKFSWFYLWSYRCVAVPSKQSTLIPHKHSHLVKRVRLHPRKLLAIFSFQILMSG